MPHIPPALRQAFRYAAITGVVLVTAAVVWTLGPGAGWVLRHVDGVHGIKGKELADALDAVRGRALALATGLAALVAVYYTARNADTARRTLQHSEESARRALEHSQETARRTAELTEQGQVTERYTKAIEQLGSDKIGIRIGGIYALERIATDSARDHPTVMEVLAAFIRERTHAHPPSDAPDTVEGAPLDPWQVSPPPGADVQAALTVIGRRTTSQDTRGILLARANLTGANLANADLTGANLFDANLVDAYLGRAVLVDAYLTSAVLADAVLADANLARADLAHANLTGADLARANLTGANLTNADLTNANLKGAVLTGAKLEGINLTHAIYANEAKWPEGYASPGNSA